MRFLYQYRTKENAIQNGEIAAPDRDAAYAALKSRGIRPSRLVDAPGFFNKVFGKGKRWLAIVALSVALVAIVAGGLFGVDGDTTGDTTDRAQIYGDPGVLKTIRSDKWSSVFADVGDRFLALHAIPCAECGCSREDALDRAAVAVSLGANAGRHIAITDGDLAEVVQIKRMVNGMKDELRAYLGAGGNVEGYMKRLDIRQQAEIGIYERARRELSATRSVEKWQERNRNLRAMGLPMVSAE